MSNLRSPHVQLALAAGASIITIALFSKYVLPEPVGYLPAAFPPFLVAIYEAVVARPRFQDSEITKTRYWVLAIFASTALVIAAYAF